MSIAQRIAPQPKAHIMCANCKCMLAFVAGHQLVKCSRCNTVNKVPPPSVDKKNCQNCRVLLQFPIDSKKVKCGSCQFINQFAR